MHQAAYYLQDKYLKVAIVAGAGPWYNPAG